SVYYIFSINNPGTGILRLNYSIVDMNMDNGRGDVTQKDIILADSTSLSMTAVRNCNNKDYWIITHKRGTFDYYAWLFTKDGITSNPVKSTANAASSSGQGISFGHNLKASPDGKKIAETGNVGNLGIVQLLDFNNTTGMVSNLLIINEVIIPSASSGAFVNTGIEFSPDSKLLYSVSGRNYNNTEEAVVYQYNISLSQPAAIINSQEVIYSGIPFLAFVVEYVNVLGDLQLAPDKKIYLGSWTNSFSVINDPDNVGVACNFVYHGFSVNSLNYYLPNILPGLFYRNIITDNNCQSLNVNFSIDNISGIDSVKWDFNDPASGAANVSAGLSPGHVFSGNGIYKVRLVIFSPNSCGNDTLYKTISAAGGLTVNLGNDMAVCFGDTLKVNNEIPDATYVWNDGSAGPKITVSQPGTYWVNVILGNCTVADTINISIKPSPVVNLGSDTTICEGQILQLDAGNPGSIFTWQDNSSSQIYLVSGPGKYFVNAVQNGCTNSDTINITYDLKPMFSIGRDTSICNGQTIILSPGIQNDTGLSYLWQDGSPGALFTVSQPGIYRVSVANYCGSTNDTVIVSEGVCKLYVPSAFTPNNDGLNDIFRANYGENVTVFEMKIYNRWGQMIFGSNDINEGWDGTFKGKEQPAGTYIWVIEYKEINNSNVYLLRGHVTLIK
ncbi:MAG TPA: gliding motility-associated C-terminal domain-containing protein, partial [Chitinophagaceae bacterium]|nr:gliding motility-associated C-terminal domain-containing protein [Chitinophagaceae bacterium]